MVGSVRKILFENLMSINISKEIIMFYVYALKNPEIHQPFYIGVGKENRRSSVRRELSHELDALKLRNGKKLYRPNKHKLYTILQILDKGLKVEIEIIHRFQTEVEAFQLEVLLIYFYGRRDLGTGILTNMTDGGEGRMNPSAEERKHASEIRKGKPSPLKGRKIGPYSEERIQNAAKGIQKFYEDGGESWKKGKKFGPLSEERRRQISLQQKGRVSHRKGKIGIFSDETRKRISTSNKGKHSGPKNKPAWNKGLSSPNKGKTYEEIYGVEKAIELKEKRRVRKIQYWKDKHSLNLDKSKIE